MVGQIDHAEGGTPARRIGVELDVDVAAEEVGANGLGKVAEGLVRRVALPQRANLDGLKGSVATRIRIEVERDGIGIGVGGCVMTHPGSLPPAPPDVAVALILKLFQFPFATGVASFQHSAALVSFMLSTSPGS